MTGPAFESMTPPQQPVTFGLAEGVYKIYKTQGEFVPVKAKSALEAIKNSGVENIFRVERDSLDKYYVLDLAKASEMLLANNPPAEAAAPPAPVTEAAAQPAAEAPKTS